MFCKEGQFDVVELMVNDHSKTFSINLNTQHVNGMTPFDLALSTVMRYSRVVNFILGKRFEQKFISLEKYESCF